MCNLISSFVEPVHLVLGGMVGALGGFLMFKGAKAAENRAILGKEYMEKLKAIESSERERVN